MALKRDKLDAIFSELVRERANWKCERCGNDYTNRRQGLHCAHIFGRARKLTRCHPWNAVALCFACHRWQGDNPVDAGDWLRGYLGKRIDHVKKLAHQVDTRKKWQRDDENANLLEWYKRQLAEMRELRANGEQGRLEFTATEPL